MAFRLGLSGLWAIREWALTGWPLGSEAFVSRLEELVGRVLRP